MTKKELMQYENKKAVATYCLCNFGGVEILDILGGEVVIYRFNFGTPEKVRYSKIYEGVNVSSFRAGRLTIRLNDCLRV